MVTEFEPQVNTDDDPELKELFSVDTFPRVMLWSKRWTQYFSRIFLNMDWPENISSANSGGARRISSMAIALITSHKAWTQQTSNYGSRNSCLYNLCRCFIYISCLNAILLGTNIAILQITNGVLGFSSIRRFLDTWIWSAWRCFQIW